MATSSDSWKIIKELFEEALQRDPKLRSSFLTEKCADTCDLECGSSRAKPTGTLEEE
jgi:hypothetical protein